MQQITAIINRVFKQIQIILNINLIFLIITFLIIRRIIYKS